jgi:signal transduction histidine kinase
VRPLGYGRSVTTGLVRRWAHARPDALLAAVLALPSLVQVLALPIAPRGVGVLVALGSTLPVAWRRTQPVLAALAGSAVWLIPTDGFLIVGYVAVFFLYYSVGAYVGDRRVVAAVAAAGIALTAAANLDRSLGIGEYLSGVLAVVAPVLVGVFVRRQRAQARRLEELTWHLERERERGARAAVAEERARIARELHDVVSHGVSLIAIQSDAAEAALERDPSLARQPLQTIRGSAKEALGEMRRLLGVLREDDEGVERAPLPTLAELPALIERARASGMDVSCELMGEQRPLHASVDLSAYRIVQEALTNARKHAPGAPAAVRLSWGDDALEVRVRDTGPGPSANGAGGHGLVGMRERVRLHGGTLHAGSPADGPGFEVVALLPYEERT